jgi:hypothetical protein
MSDELIEAAARAIEQSQTRWIGIDPGSPLFLREVARAAYAVLAPALIERGAAMAKRKGQELYMGTETWAAFNALDPATIARNEP